MKGWHLTRQAQDSLVDIAIWTIETFGHRQADVYEQELVARCQAIADGTAGSQSCSVLIGGDVETDVRFTRAGEHFVVFTARATEVVILDFLHGRCDLPRRITGLTL